MKKRRQKRKELYNLESNFYLIDFKLEGGSCEGCPRGFFITKNKDICFLEKNYKFVPRVYFG